MPIMLGAFVDRELRDEDAVVRKGGDGTHFDKNDPRVKANPGGYAPAVPAGIKRADALVALAEMSHTSADGNVTTAHAGQWVHYESVLVIFNPHSFALPMMERRP
jgi:hypothetical protein